VVNPDIFLAGIWAAALYLMVVLVKRGPTRGRIAWLAALGIASCLAQPRGVAIIIPGGAAIGLAFWRHRRPVRRWVRRAVAGGAAVVAVAGLAMLLDYALLGRFSAERLREFASYLWQFYLPKVSFMSPSVSHGFGVRQVFVERLFGGFANLEANFPHRVYTALELIFAIVLASALVGVVRRRADVRRRCDVVAVGLLAVVGYMAVLHVAAFRSLLGSPDPVITGRYLLPLLPLYGVTVALAVAWLPRRWGPVAAGALVGGVVLLQLAAMGVLFARFYA
jgi:hypothetical protein